MPLRGKQHVTQWDTTAHCVKNKTCVKNVLYYKFVLMASIRAAVGWERPWELSCLSLGSGSRYILLPNRPACSSTQ